MTSDQLAALVAIIDTGSFDAAARHLQLTPSAVSQRIKALESQLGQLVVVRGSPARATAAGQVLVRTARQQQLLMADAVRELGGAAAGVRFKLPIAVNADSLATWFPPVLAAIADWPDAALELHVEDEDHSSALLRAGVVLGAVTADATPTHGCAVVPLGGLRYLPLATPDLRRRFTSGGRPDLTAMPVVRFNAKDDLQHRFLLERGFQGDRGGRPERGGPPDDVTTAGTTHSVPSSHGFLDAVRAGLGWGMVPTAQCAGDLTAGRLVRVADGHLDIPLYWQVWRLTSPRLAALTRAVTAAAAGLAGHRPPDRGLPG